MKADWFLICRGQRDSIWACNVCPDEHCTAFAVKRPQECKKEVKDEKDSGLADNRTQLP